MLLAVRSVNFMAMQSLKIYKGFDRENDWGCKVSPRMTFHGQIPYKSLNFTWTRLHVVVSLFAELISLQLRLIPKRLRKQ